VRSSASQSFPQPTAGKSRRRRHRIQRRWRLQPEGLVKTKLTPIALTAEGKINILDGTHSKIDKKFTYKGKQVSVLSAKCPDGKLQAHATGVFTDGTRISTDFIRTCTGKG
jgi:hypothetical protein